MPLQIVHFAFGATEDVLTLRPAGIAMLEWDSTE